VSDGCQTPPFIIQPNKEKGQEDRGEDEEKDIITLLAHSQSHSIFKT
jgi:hypothetical protein